MKKLFTLVALMAICLGAKAEWVEDYKVDYSTYSGFPFYVMGYVPEWIDGVMTDFGANYKYAEVKDDAEETSDVIVTTQGGAEYYRWTEGGGWHQYFIADGIPTEIDGSYTVTAMVKASEACNINVNMGWGWGDGQQVSTSVAIGTDWAEVEWEYTGIGGTSCNLVAQPGGFTGVIEWQWLKVSHNQKAQKPITWVEMLENGDASKDWSEIVETGAETLFTDQDNNFKICAWSKDNQGDPYPSPIEEVDGDRVFVVHATDCPTPEEDASAWDNQFWIQSPQNWKPGEQLKISFRYKASQPAKTNTQIHKQNPSDYKHWAAIGDITFTTEWQEFNKVISWPDAAGDEGWSVAFNLNPDVKTATDFYFDDLSWCKMKLDEGYFVAGCNTKTGLEYDFDNAIQFEQVDDDLYVATIGEEGNTDSYVDQIMISTVRGNDAAFKSATLTVTDAIVNDEDEWNDYSEKAVAKLNLPGEGVWMIQIDTDYKSMSFKMVEGTVKEPIEVVANPEEFEINALERPLMDNELEISREPGEDGELGTEDDVVTYAPGEGGQAWDNQMWICANRKLDKGEVTYLEFKYKATKPAKASTQSHGNPGAYLHWAAIGDVNFTEDWQTFTRTITVEDAANGMQTIAFNLAEMKEANDYFIKDVIWVVGSKDESYESLIATTGDKHIAWKVLGGDIIVGHGGETALTGDVNGDGKVDIADLNVVIDVVMGDATANTDVNGDNKVDIADVNAVIDIIMGE